MNTILQKRIDEMAEAIAPFNRMSQKRDYFIKGAEWMLNNLWISVEEALPEDGELYFVRYKSNDFVLYGTGELDEDGWYVDSSGYEEVTHWMPIPSLKGGEE